MVASKKLELYVHRGLQWYDGRLIANAGTAPGGLELIVSDQQTMRLVSCERFGSLDDLEVAMRKVHDDLRHWRVLPEDTCE